MMEQEVLLWYCPRNKPLNATAHSLTRDLRICSGFANSASILTFSYSSLCLSHCFGQWIGDGEFFHLEWDPPYGHMLIEYYI